MTQLRSFMGLAFYYRKFIKNFAKIAAPLNKYLNSTNKHVLLSKEAIEAFEKLKQELTDMDKVLALPNSSLSFILETDASDNCAGAALMQDIDGKDLPIAFFSRTMNAAEKNYATSQKELLAIVKTVEHFRQFLYRKEFTVKTDHAPLTSIKTNSKPSARIGRWLEDLADYNFKIQHKKGKDNILADALSRLNLPEFFQPEETFTDKIINYICIDNIEEVEIIEFCNLIQDEEVEETTYSSDKIEPDPIELNSLDFLVSAMSFFDGEAKGKLSPSGQSPAIPLRNLDSTFNAELRETMRRGGQQCDSRKFLVNFKKSCSCLVMSELLDNPKEDDSTNMIVNRNRKAQTVVY